MTVMTGIRDVLEENPDYIEVLQDIVDYLDENKDPDGAFVQDTEYKASFTHKDVPHTPQTLYQLESNGIIERVFDSNSSTVYALKNRGEVRKQIKMLEETYDDGMLTHMHDFPDEEKLPEGLFDDVVGYEDVKWLIRRGMTQDSITNFLLIGPPGSAKTVFLMCIANYEDAEFVPASDSSSAGFMETMFKEKPKYMLLDELDDMDEDDQSSLSSYTETGILKETKYKKKREMRTNTKTLATANDESEIQDYILDRFVTLHFDPYTKEEFMEVCEHILPRKEGKDEAEAKKIAEEVWRMEGEGNVRKAIAVARLSDGDPERVISVLDDYSPSGLQSLTSP